ncbi:hypothetical protein HMN09_00310300 [Mycena chlorophos]|uniref:Uncharacterized protein n=1 Tax=Mycena chlorophos TaxID=658473 RepID=A0A8H6TI79_MYCCL|nr:hypothetical protein HMN09_00310300 [Mycena chlorophos]
MRYSFTADELLQAQLEAQRERTRAAALAAELEQMKLNELEERISRADRPPSAAKSAPSSPPQGTSRRFVPTSPRVRPGPVRTSLAKTSVFVVFRGYSIGIKENMREVNASIGDFRGEVFQGYPDTQSAERAFKVASAAGLTSTISLRSGRLPIEVAAAPRPLEPEDLHNNDRLQGRAWNDSWYVCYVGIEPGVYPTWIECAVNAKWAKSGEWEVFRSFGDAYEAYCRAATSNRTRISRVGRDR